jgi:electron transfer flavoprotein beta subunit
MVPPMLAEVLGLPQLTSAKHVEVADGTLTVHRQTEAGYQVVTAEAPALVTVTAGIAEPRYASLKGIMAARSKEVKVLGLDDLGIEPGRPAETILRVVDAETRKAGEIVEDDGSVGVEKIMAVLQAAKVL